MYFSMTLETVPFLPEQSGLAWSFASFLTLHSWRYFDFPLTTFESSHHPAFLHISNPATSLCLSLYGTMRETDAFYFIFLTRPHLSPKLGLPRSHKNWALRLQETRAGRFWINYVSPVFYIYLQEPMKPPAFTLLFTSLGFPINQTTSLLLLHFGYTTSSLRLLSFVQRFD